MIPSPGSAEHRDMFRKYEMGRMHVADFVSCVFSSDVQPSMEEINATRNRNAGRPVFKARNRNVGESPFKA